MTRRKTVWWSRLVATSPQSLLRRPEGQLLVEILTEWWTELEGFADGTWTSVDHSRRAAQSRYYRSTFYARLDAVGFAPLPDVDEHAVDGIFDAFASWTCGRKARKLVDRLDSDIGSDVDIDQVQDHLGHQIHHHVHHQVHHHVSHEVHHHIHAQVHHAVSHVAHDAGAGGGHGDGGGGGGGHH